MSMDDLFRQHTNIALSFSGGKDSLACLYLLQPYWDRLTVYWMNPGNPFPETVDMMANVRALVPSFKEVRGRQAEIIDAHGWPSDVIPHRYTTDGNKVFGPTPFKLQTRLDCCLRSLMLPMYQAMVADGVTCCIRGKRHDEADKTGVQSGHISPDGMELVFPIYSWSEADVLEFLKGRNIELPPYYRHAKHSLDCMDCTAWWGEGLSRYLKAEHPESFKTYQKRIALIKVAVAEEMASCEL